MRRGVFRTRHKLGKTTLYAKRNPDGTFADIQSFKKAVPRNIAQHSKRRVKPGYGFRGDTR